MIVIATIARPVGRTGVQTHFNAVLDFLRAQNREPVLVTPFSDLGLMGRAIFGVRRVIAPLSPAMNVWWYEHWHYRFLKQTLERILADAGDVVVYAQCPVSAKAALEARKSSQQRVVMAVHFNVSQADEWVAQVGLSPSGRLYHSIRRREERVLPALDGLVYVSEYARAAVQRRIPVTERVRSAVLPNFVSDERSDPVRDVGGDLISIGTLESRKNQAYLIRVLAEARALNRTYHLTLVGEGPDRAALSRLAESLRVIDQVRFLGDQPNARRFLRSHRVYVHSARMENFPVTLVEAMAEARPICAAPVGGIPEAFTEGVEGFFWDLDDPAAGARKLITLLEDPALCTRMSVAARDRFCKQFETSRVAEQLIEFLDSA